MARARGFNITMLGDKKLAKDLKRLEIKMQKRIVKKAINRGAIMLRNAVRAAAPVGKTGNLKKYIHKITFSSARSGLLGARVQPGKREQMGIAASDPYYYPAIVEYKFKSYLRATLDTLRNTILEKVRQEIKRGVESG